MSGPAPASPLRPSRGLQLASWLVPLAAALWAARDLLAPWDVDGHSVYLNLIRLVALDATLRDGGTTLRWLPPLYAGHGSPIFNFLAPLPTLLALGLHRLGAEPGLAIRLVFALSLVGMAASTTWLARALAGPWAGLLAGVLVVLAPYPLCDVYVRAQLGETLVLALAPLVLLCVHRLGDERAGPWLVLGSAALALGVLGHNVGALMLGALAVAAVLARAAQGPWRRVALRGGLLLGLGLGLSAWFWLPALGELGEVQARQALTAGPLAHDQHFVTAGQLLGDAWGHGVSGPGDQDGMPLQAGRLHLLLWATAAGLALWRRRGVPALSWLALAAAPVALWLTTAASAWLWRALPLMPYVQFPWRFLLVFTLAAALAGGQVAALAAARLRPPWRGVLAGLLVLAVLVTSAHQVRARFVRYAVASGQSATFDRAHGPQVEREPGLLPLDRVFTVERVRAGGSTATIGDDYLPRTVVDRPRAPAARGVEVVAGSATLLEVRSTAHQHQVRLRAATPARLRVAQFAFAGWQASLDGAPAPIQVEPRSGLILVEVPAGEHALALRFGSTPLRTAAWLLTLAALLGLAAGLGWAGRRWRGGGGQGHGS